METQNCPAEPSSSSTDPIATVRLWPVLVMALVAGTLGAVLLPSSLSPDLREKAYGGVMLGSIIVWWLDCVAGATRRAGFQPWTRSAGAVLLLSLKVAVAVVLTKSVWLLLSRALGLPFLGLVAGPTPRASEPTAQSLAVNLFVVALVAPVAEEMLFRGALFRKWRLRLGPGKAAVLTSVLFGLAHASAPTSFLSALSMAVLYTTTRTIWAPVAAHATNNFFSVTLGHSAHFMPLAVLEAVADWRLQLAFLVPGLIGTVWLARFLRRGWQTLGDPVHGVRLDRGAGSRGATEHADESEPRTAARAS